MLSGKPGGMARLELTHSEGGVDVDGKSWHVMRKQIQGRAALERNAR